MNTKTFFFILLTLNVTDIFAQFNYLETLQKYWNYRYHLTGDGIIKGQHMPWEDDYRYKLGEPGMVVVGDEVGNSIPSTNISLYNLYPYPDSDPNKNFNDPRTPWGEWWL